MSQGELPLAPVRIVTDRTEQIRILNDTLRQKGLGGKILLTSGVSSLSFAGQMAVLRAIREFTAFTPDGDPHGEHDFVSVDVSGTRYFAKIDYYDLTCEFGSEDPADPRKTTRVMTIMRADEY